MTRTDILNNYCEPKKPRLRVLVATLAALVISVTSVVGRAEVTEIGNAELKSLLQGGANIIDLRRQDEWRETGIVDRSIELTFFDKNGNHNAKKWLDQVQGLADFNEPLILICHTGVRSKVVADWLDNVSGYKEIYNVSEGIAQWIKHGLPVVKSNQ